MKENGWETPMSFWVKSTPCRIILMLLLFKIILFLGLFISQFKLVVVMVRIWMRWIPEENLAKASMPFITHNSPSV